MPLASIDFFSGIVAPLVAGFGTLDALAVDNCRAGVPLASLHLARMLPQVRVNGDPQAVALPEPQVVVDSSPSGEVGRQVAPLATGLEKVEDRIEQFPKQMFAGSPLLVGPRETKVDELPFGVGKVRCVSHRHCVTGCGTRYKLSLKLPLDDFSNRL